MGTGCGGDDTAKPGDTAQPGDGAPPGDPAEPNSVSGSDDPAKLSDPVEPPQPGTGAEQPASVSGASHRRVLVTMHDDVDAGDAEVIAQLTDCGLEVGEVSELLGIVHGEAEPEGIERLRALPTVLAVEDEGEVTTQPSPDPPSPGPASPGSSPTESESPPSEPPQT